VKLLCRSTNIAV